jgi:hypothetical protein
LVYKRHHNIVSIDEKWFYVDPPKKKLKYLPDHPYHQNNTTQHKDHIPKIMIQAAISEPTETFDGKVGILYHGDIVPAQRNSARRPRGTPELKSRNVDGAEFFDSQVKVDEDIEMTGIIDMITLGFCRPRSAQGFFTDLGRATSMT